MIARGDRGGLANMLTEFAVHLQPARVLLMDLAQHGRGPTDPTKFDGLDVRLVRGLDTSAEDRRWLIEGSDVIYTAETAYGDALWGEARAAGVPTVLHVMPELYLPSRAADKLWLPTRWLESAFPGADLVPVPIATERFARRLRSPARHFVHLAAPAMLDRNGTNIVLASLRHITAEVVVTLLGLDSRVESPRPNVELRCPERRSAENYWELFDDEGDALLMPRRYAGLSLPVQEAWAMGMPAIMTGIEPQRSWRGVVDVVPKSRGECVRMGSKDIYVVGCDPRELAAVIDHYALSPAWAEAMSQQASVAADELSWERLLPVYRQKLQDLVDSGR